MQKTHRSTLSDLKESQVADLVLLNTWLIPVFSVEYNIRVITFPYVYLILISIIPRQSTTLSMGHIGDH